MPFTNIFKGFRQPGEQNNITSGILVPTRRFDEPTYLTFAVQFYSKDTEINTNTNYDKMPMPLFVRGTEQADQFDTRNNYSAYNYLRDINEFVRAELMHRFIDSFNTIQSEFQWYFQSIEGLENLLQVDPGRGKRVAEDARITINMLEGLDQRMTQMMSTYKKIVWDDVYQRWILPDMMRYFAMDIFITEFRTFHQSSIRNSDNLNPNTNEPNKGGEMVLSIIENTMPTIVLKCERCEFDITTVNRNISSLNVNEEPEMLNMSFDIKVGDVTEEYINPAMDLYFNDKDVNGLNRTREFSIPLNDQVPTGTAPGNTPNSSQEVNNPTRVIGNNKVYSNTSLSAQQQLLINTDHIPGTPFNENGQVNNLKNASPNAAIDESSINPTQPNTWFGNAVTFGRSFLTNEVESVIDKAKMTKIPGLGISVNEAIGAIESKNFLTAFGLIRQAVNRTFELSAPPSSLLSEQIVDGTFREILTSIATSDATDGESLELIKAADLALNDNGVFSRIRDLSLATDLVSRALQEQNIPNPVRNRNDYASQVAIQTNNDRSLATDLDGEPKQIEGGNILIEGLPSSSATNNKIQG